MKLNPKINKIKVVTTLILMLSLVQFSAAQQITINRIEQMPGQPTPYEMRDWKRVTLGYDSLVFDFDRTGEYLPLITWVNNTINYPQHISFGLHTVVGTTSPGSSEAINVIPAVVGASLAGIDKSLQNGHNWALYCEEFFNKRPEENVYLNHPVAQSGNDWWYDTMPNVFFYQLYYLYPQTGDFANQFLSVADQWLTAVLAMGAGAAPWTLPDMDHRAWSLSTMKPYDMGVHEPEAAGAIGWLLYQAYQESGQKKYREGAEWAIEFLNNRPGNPAYELQLSYGVYMAARMNAELGTEYDIEKMINWCFDVGPLRNWGAILGHWGVYDVHGLIGEADGTDYAFLMNTFEQIGALVPLVRYDDRFARTIGKWVLNAANACRLFYPNYLSDLNQDSEDWAHLYDPESYIGHEAMRQGANGFPYATGDAIDGGWGETNLVLYGSSHVGILGGIVDTTNVEKILQLDLLKTDYFHNPAYPSYLYFNPYEEEKVITIRSGEGNHDIYDALTNQFIATGISGPTMIRIPADAAILAVIVPASGTVTYNLDQLLIDGIIVDYRSGQAINNYPPRIKGLAPAASEVTLNDSTLIYCTAEDRDNDMLTYLWQATGGEIKGNGANVKWLAPSTAVSVKIICQVSDGNGGQDSSSFIIKATERVNHDPVIEEIRAVPRKIDLGASCILTCTAADPDGDLLVYNWSAKTGSLEGADSSVVWTAPAVKGDFFVVCRVTDAYGGESNDSINIAVRDLSVVETGDLVAYYPFDGNSNDLSGFGNNGTVSGAVLTPDRFTTQNAAYLFNGINDLILVPNSASLNFQHSITVNFWMKITEFFTDREAYPLSHGNWERRWKFSIYDRKIRWTVKTQDQIKDIDADTQLNLNTWYNISGLYNGSDFEIYINGVLNNFTPLTGLISTTTVDFTIGQALPDNSRYNFAGVLDDIRIYDYALSQSEIAALYDLDTAIRDKQQQTLDFENLLEQNYPNPFNGKTTIRYRIRKPGLVQISVFDVLGRKIRSLVNERQGAGSYRIDWDGRNEEVSITTSGIYFYELKTSDFIQRRKFLFIK